MNPSKEASNSVVEAFDKWWCSVRPFPEDMTDGDLAKAAWLAALQSREGEWENVKDGRPANMQRVWCIIKDKGTGHYSDALIWWSAGKRWTRTDCTPLKNDQTVTHWRPLPAPPTTPSPEEGASR